MSMHHVLVWLICAGVMIGVLVLLDYSFHADAISLDTNMREEWNRVLTDEEKARDYHEHFEELKERCKFDLTLIGIGAACLSGILVRPPACQPCCRPAIHPRVLLTRLRVFSFCQFTLMVVVGTIRSHIFD